MYIKNITLLDCKQHYIRNAVVIRDCIYGLCYTINAIARPVGMEWLPRGGRERPLDSLFTENQAWSTSIEGAKGQDTYIFQWTKKGHNIPICKSCKRPTYL